MALGTVEDYWGQVEQARLSTESTVTPLNTTVYNYTEHSFTILRNRLTQSTTSDLDQITSEAAALSRLRAYLYPASEIPLQGASALSTMEQWGLPELALNPIRKQIVTELTNPDLTKARAALYSLFKEYDEWSDYLDDYNHNMSMLSGWMAALIIALLPSSIYLLSTGYLKLGVCVAGLSGALLSVALKIPALLLSGDSAPHFRGAMRRVAAGFAGSIIGIGFLSSGMVTVNLPKNRTLEDLLSGSSPIPMAPLDIFLIVALLTTLGLSERVITSFEEKLFSEGPPKH